MSMRSFPMAVAAAAVLCSAACFPPHQAVRRESFARIDADQRGKLFDRALQVLLDRGWIVAGVDREVGVLSTQPRETYLRDWVSYQQDTVQVSFRAGDRLAVSLHRQIRSASPGATAHHAGPGGGVTTTSGGVPFGPDPARVEAEAAADREAILFEIMSDTPVAALDRCRKLAGEYAGALAQARACGELGARSCGGQRPAWDQARQVPGRGQVRVVPSRTAELDRVLAEYRQAGCAFSDWGASTVDAGDECLGFAGRATCQ